MTDAAPTPPGAAAPADPFDVAAFQHRPRLSGTAVSPDGRRVVVGVAALDTTGARFVGSLWDVDADGARAARRLTRGAKGEGQPVFTPDGDLLFVSARPDPTGSAARGRDDHRDEDSSDGDRGDDGEGDEPPTALWLLPAGGGEARRVAARPGGISGVAVAREAGTVVLASPTLPSSTGPDDERRAVADRRTARVTAILHEGVPVRFWDHDLGPAAPRLFLATPPDGAADPAGPVDPVDPEAPWTLRDLTGHVGRALDEASFDLSPDGTTLVTDWQVAEPHGSVRWTVVAVDVATGDRRTLAGDPDHEYTGPRVSPDGTTVALLRESITTPDRPPTLEVVVVPLAGGEVRVLPLDPDAWPHTLRWTPDGRALVVHADHHGRAPLFRVPVAPDGGDPVRLTPDDGNYAEFELLPGGDVVALRSAVDAAPAPVRVAAAGGDPTPLRGPERVVPPVPGRLTEITATAADGTALRAWLVLPPDADADHPAPLLLWIHGGPLSSWNGWSWRWNPWLLARHGYAVLLPDPGLSTGYGPAMVRRGWGAWGAEPFTDLMTVTDAACARDDVDGTRTAAMGGSFGGYMANWVAGHTDRFAAIVTHASLWNLETFGAVTDAPWYWAREFTPEAMVAHSPHRSVGEIRTPVLVVHGDRDHRVPIGEGLALWWALASDSPAAAAVGATGGGTGPGAPDAAPGPGFPHRFLYFPDENHWVLTPNHARVWYDTVLAFLAQHVLGRPWVRPARLG